METDLNQLMQYINYEAYCEAKKAHALNRQYLGLNIRFTPSEMQKDGWIATPIIESLSSNSEETIHEYANKSGWKTYQIYQVEQILKEFER